MKLNLRTMGVLAIATTLTLTACKKDRSSGEDLSTELTTQSDDQTRFAAEMESTDGEINDVAESTASFSGRLADAAGIAAICNATITADSTATLRRLTIVYNGLNCAGTRTRTGTVQLSMPLGTRWKDAGAVMTVSLQALKITRVSDGKSMTFNGTRTLTNVSGGRLVQLATLGTITHTVTSNNMSVTFDDGTSRNWQVARKRVFTYSGGAVLTITGTHTDGSTTGISEWGTNRLGRSFVTSITQPIVIRQDCDFRITAGQVLHSRLPAEGTVTFGLNASGAPTSCPGTGTYYYKLVWTGAGGNSFSVIRPY